jgi:hypothetical protein
VKTMTTQKIQRQQQMQRQKADRLRGMTDKKSKGNSNDKGKATARAVEVGRWDRLIGFIGVVRV